MTDALVLYEKYRVENGDESTFTVPKERLTRIESFYNFMKQYVDFVNEDQTPYVPTKKGSGRYNDIIQSTPPPLLYDDIKNDPYFITM